MKGKLKMRSAKRFIKAWMRNYSRLVPTGTIPMIG